MPGSQTRSGAVIWAVDTNVVIRFLTGDDPAQASRARAEIDAGDVFVPRTVLLECDWVLRSLYGFEAGQVVAALRALAGLPGIVVEDATLVARAMGWAARGMELADALHLAAAAGCERFLTFDRRMARQAAEFDGAMVAPP